MNYIGTFFDLLLTVQHLSIFILVINQLDAHNLFYSKFISCPYLFRAPCARRQDVKIVLYNIWHHQTCRLPFCARDGHLQVWWYQMLYNTILTSWRWARGARNMQRHEINLLYNKFCASSCLITKIKIHRYIYSRLHGITLQTMAIYRDTGMITWNVNNWYVNTSSRWRGSW